MKLVFLGAGSAFTVGAHNYQSNMVLIDDNEEKLLLDCGSDARLSSYELGLTYKDFTDVYISHLHADHAGGLEWLAFSRYFDKQCKKTNLYIARSLVDDLWNKVLAGGLETLDGNTAALSTYFNITPVEESGFFKWNQQELRLVPTVHLVLGSEICPSYGVIFRCNHRTVFITTDTQFCPDRLMDVYHGADIIFHDCETSSIKSHVHAHFEDLKSLDPAIRRKMWLYHYSPGLLPDAKEAGFRGFVKKGQVFNFSDEDTLL